jgi:hypothetical protein
MSPAFAVISSPFSASMFWLWDVIGVTKNASSRASAMVLSIASSSWSSHHCSDAATNIGALSLILLLPLTVTETGFPFYVLMITFFDFGTGVNLRDTSINSDIFLDAPKPVLGTFKISAIV